jgi:hypothetical protein
MYFCTEADLDDDSPSSEEATGAEDSSVPHSYALCFVYFTHYGASFVHLLFPKDILS